MGLKTEWDLSVLFSSDDDPKIEKLRNKSKKIVDGFVKKWKSDKGYLKNEDKLLVALEEYDSLNLSAEDAGGDGAGTNDGFYFWLKLEKDKNNPKLKAKYGKSIEFANKIANELMFFKLDLAKISVDDQKKFLKSEKLKKYRHFLELIFNESKYMLSEEAEKVIALKYKTSHENWDQMVSGILAKEENDVLNKGGKKEMKNFSEIMNLLNDTNKKVRDDAARVLNEILERHKDIAEIEFNSILANHKVDDDLRGADRPDKMRHISDDIDSDVVDELIEVVSSRFDIAKKFYALKAKMLGFKKLAYHERKKHITSSKIKYS